MRMIDRGQNDVEAVDIAIWGLGLKYPPAPIKLLK